MNSQEKLYLTEEIKKRLIKVEEQINELKELCKPVEPDCAIGRVSRMDAINNKSINDIALKKKLLQFEGLKAALDNIDDKDFGKCLVCGAEIPMGRILIMPESRKCINCSNR
jgi:DnaK suppressor protein